MNVYQLNTSLPFSSPDLSVMAASKQLINVQAMSLRLAFLSAMDDKLQHLDITINRADQVFRDELRNVFVILDTTHLAPIDTKIQQIKDSDRLTAAQQQRGIDLLNQEKMRIIATVITSIQKGARSISRGADDISAINLKLKDGTLHTTLQNRINTLTQKNAGLNVQLSNIVDDRRTLSEAIKVFEKYNIADLFKDTLPTAAELGALNIEMPEIAAIQLAAGRLEKLLEHVSRTLNYVDLINERDKLRNRYNALTTQSRDIDAEINTLIDQSNQLMGLANVEQTKTVWVQEAQKVAKSFQIFLGSNSNDVLLDENFSQHLVQLKAYVHSFYTVTRTL
ncbi:alpha-xenorhabdolysin family binary toxin subunit B [Pseudomonas sp. RTC3]|uniref:alpha-xenorhabdolysin family binary toxin subunit B n=1 Tax=Pseudomonas sp. 5C2 TaxID=3048588 RepID=UPI002AB51C17|nr:alpha-xenorhabdolysin family binary toxin subunit B [Pseudomonas sp. 5C2]MDY7566297.1 alpha-xenorhabdolysin family binary toxin subunit B [Pseudomonas sp. 5C2]MEB0062301.1 alpha-xenorhabdolysin family binary toxin subunit B [Pseudomonas sp. RTC3]MEB0240284.1 alpha-xenorhabdolysin family binary toxin subunit B [Pseudomonas sp. 5C2]